jgi:Phospholipase_D-nuclease N-terminal
MAWFLWLGMLVVIVIDIAAIVDVARRRDLGGGAKALWVVLLLLLPLIGVIAYVIARPSIVDAGDDPEQAKKAASEAASERARERATEEGLGDYR